MMTIAMMMILVFLLSLITSMNAYSTMGYRSRGYMSMGLRSKVWDKVKSIVGRGKNSGSKRTDDELKSGSKF